MNKKAVLLLSGGLDSTLAARVLHDQGIELTAVNFTSPFCNCSGRREGCRNQAVVVAQQLNIPIRVLVKGMDYLKLVENPPHGYGSQMNPCVDCRIYILKKAKELMQELGASFVATGEVLGQRPNSQQRHSLALIERESGLQGLILRPLSALHFAPTEPEKAGVVDRQQLLDIAGRGRKKQIELATRYGISDYPCPAGGCLLTEKTIAARLRDLFQHKPDYNMRDVSFLVLGRHLRLSPELKLILGHNERENQKIVALGGATAQIIKPLSFRGPTALVDGALKGDKEEMIGRILASYSRDEAEIYELEITEGGERRKKFTVTQKLPREILAALRIE